MTMSVSITQMDVPLPPPALVATNLIAQPGGQIGATPVYARKNVFTNVTPGSAAILQLLPDPSVTLFNRCGTGVALTVFPIVGMRIESSAVNVPVTIADGDQVTFTWDGSITWLIS